MKRPLEVVSGIAVFLLSVLSSMAVFQMFFTFQQRGYRVPLISIVSLCAMGLLVALSFIGAYILLSWANKPK